MAKQVCMGAMLKCNFGNAPSTLMVLPINGLYTPFMPAANIMDYAPLVNILPFGMCSSLANPTVVTATAAAMGALTPMPCLPVTAAPWVVGSPTFLIGTMPALNDTSKLMCTWGGVIEVNNPGQTAMDIP
ncbi:MAG: DUF4280 domain-containing protein [Candidatus Tectimicrobiota bacterium]